jgi:hypothetical protein
MFLNFKIITVNCKVHQLSDTADIAPEQIKAGAVVLTFTGSCAMRTVVEEIGHNSYLNLI